MTVSKPADIHSAVEQAFNAGDLDRLIRLYEKDARMVTPDGSVVEGVDAIREQWQGFLAMNGQMTLKTRFAVEMDDVALIRTDWSFASADAQLPQAQPRSFGDSPTEPGSTSSIIRSAAVT
jgi:uncharacterized protein (TIGR02246 family)